MAKFQDYTTDMEAQNIASELQDRFSTMFENHDLSRVVFYRVRGKNSKVPTKTVTTGFPFDAVGGTYVYYVLIYEKQWELLADEQRRMAVFEAMIGMHPDGFDEESNNYAKLRKRDVDEYSEVLYAAGGIHNWKEVGVNIPDILEPIEKEDSEEPQEEMTEI